MVPPFIRSVRRTLAAAAGIASLLGPGIAQAHCIDFDGDGKCAPHDHDAKVPSVDTSSGTYRAPPSEPRREERKEEPKRDKPEKENRPPAKVPNHNYVLHP